MILLLIHLYVNLYHIFYMFILLIHLFVNLYYIFLLIIATIFIIFFSLKLSFPFHPCITPGYEGIHVLCLRTFSIFLQFQSVVKLYFLFFFFANIFVNVLFLNYLELFFMKENDINIFPVAQVWSLGARDCVDLIHLGITLLLGRNMNTLLLFSCTPVLDADSCIITMPHHKMNLVLHEDIIDIK